MFSAAGRFKWDWFKINYDASDHHNEETCYSHNIFVFVQMLFNNVASLYTGISNIKLKYMSYT